MKTVWLDVVNTYRKLRHQEENDWDVPSLQETMKGLPGTEGMRGPSGSTDWHLTLHSSNLPTFLPSPQKGHTPSLPCSFGPCDWVLPNDMEEETHHLERQLLKIINFSFRLCSGCCPYPEGPWVTLQLQKLTVLQLWREINFYYTKPKTLWDHLNISYNIPLLLLPFQITA